VICFVTVCLLFGLVIYDILLCFVEIHTNLASAWNDFLCELSDVSLSNVIIFFQLTTSRLLHSFVQSHVIVWLG